jgi:1,2-diacylglycerol-3-alpha-glucose alpha-1,2-galactosyltransferase
MVSESEISVRGHGVHTAYLELTRALQARDDCTVVVNQFLRFVRADVTHIHTIGLPSLTKLLFGSGKKVVSVHIVPASLVGSIAGAHVWLPIARVYMKFFYKRADKLFAVSNMVASILEKEFGIPKSKIEVTYNTIDTNQYQTSIPDKKAARQSLKIDNEDFVVVGNGQIQPRKRFDDFLGVADKLSDIDFIWIGGIPFRGIGADYKKMQNLIDNVPVNVTVTGVIELDEVKKYLQAADVFMLPAEQENHPMAVIEAAATGLPIILRDIPEYDDTFAPDFIGCKTNEEFADAVTDLKKDPKLYVRFRDAAKSIAQRFDSRAGANQAMKIYQELTA